MRISDWSSDVCSSDLFGYAEGLLRHGLQSLRASDCEAAFLEEETYHLGEDVVLTRGRRFEARINGFHCLELVTKAELLDESNAMHHCVAGYASFVRSGQSRIVRIRHPDKRLWSTAELVTGAGKWRSEERSVGQQCVGTCRTRWSAAHSKKKPKKH